MNNHPESSGPSTTRAAALPYGTHIKEEGSAIVQRVYNMHDDSFSIASVTECTHQALNDLVGPKWRKDYDSTDNPSWHLTLQPPVELDSHTEAISIKIKARKVVSHDGRRPGKWGAIPTKGSITAKVTCQHPDLTVSFRRKEMEYN